MVEVCEGAPVAVSGWVLTDRHDVRLNFSNFGLKFHNFETQKRLTKIELNRRFNGLILCLCVAVCVFYFYTSNYTETVMQICGRYASKVNSILYSGW